LDGYRDLDARTEVGSGRGTYAGDSGSKSGFEVRGRARTSSDYGVSDVESECGSVGRRRSSAASLSVRSSSTVPEGYSRARSESVNRRSSSVRSSISVPMDISCDENSDDDSVSTASNDGSDVSSSEGGDGPGSDVEMCEEEDGDGDDGDVDSYDDDY
jgi:hypothetical protein